ncbi:FecR domain-containing protein [Pseudorhodoferax sp. LjRoot39]|uniref:FecR family protein n=1 Tax=Pseudorhodoferax sp. LjRoot39 TaxID=3342328 RepID=UPI003ECF21E1
MVADRTPAAQAAIAWMVELRSGEAGAAERAAFDLWLAADPAHAQAWQRLTCAVGQAFADVPARASGAADAVGHALALSAQRVARRRRVLRGALGVAGVSLAAGWAGREAGLLPDWQADLHTATGERRRHVLADGSQLLLDARSSVDLRFSAAERAIHLRRGQLIASVQPGPAPFVVHTAQGRVQALGTRFMVRQAEGRSLAVVLEHSVELATRDGQQRQLLRAGEAAWIAADGIAPLPADAWAEGAADWQRGRLVAQDQPLSEVVLALRAYRRGLLQVSAEAARLRVSGHYPLDDTDASLQLLAETLPIDVRVYRGGWLVRIAMRA